MDIKLHLELTQKEAKAIQAALSGMSSILCNYSNNNELFRIVQKLEEKVTYFSIYGKLEE